MREDAYSCGNWLRFAEDECTTLGVHKRRSVTVKDFHKLAAWNKAHSLVLQVYPATKTFPGDERYGLTAQLRRSAISIAANLAEGCGRASDGSFASFVQIAYGSASETQYHLLLSRDLGMLDPTTYQDLSERASEIKRMLLALQRTLQKDAARPRRG